MNLDGRFISQSQRRVGRQHLWARPAEGLVDRILGGGQLEKILKASEDIAIPLPIGCLPQVAAYRGMLLPVPQGGGFSSLGDLISEATSGGKLQPLVFQKTGATGVASSSSTLWYAAGMPAAGANAAAMSSNGADQSVSTTGALKFTNPAGGDTTHIVSAWAMPSVALNTLLLFDRIWGGAMAFSSAAEQTFTMTAARYAGTGAGGSSIGNVVILEISVTLGATAHTWSFKYKDDNDNTAEASGAVTGVSGAVTPRLDVAASQPFFAALNSGDLGASKLTSFTWSTASLTVGAGQLVLAHPLLFIPQPVANQMVIIDGINSAFNLVRVYDSACLSFLELWKNATTATNYQGTINLVSG